MQYSTIKADARFLATGDNSNTNFSDSDCNRLAHQGYLEAIALCFGNDSSWQFLGTYALLDIADNTYKYHLDDIVFIDTVEIKESPDADEYTMSKLIDPVIRKSYDLTNYTPATPEHDLRGDYILLFKNTAFEATTNGLKIRIKDLPTALSSDADTPKLPEPFHNYISTYMAYKYCRGNNIKDRAKELKFDLYGDPSIRGDEGIAGKLEKWMANRAESKPLAIEPFVENNE